MSDVPLARSGKSALDVATQAAKDAGDIILSHFHSSKEPKLKGRGNLVTKVDALSEKLILDHLIDEYPGCNILSEESNSSAPTNGYTWIVDPLDGTSNYVFGIPFFCINIAFAYNDDILMGVTYDPLRGELFQAVKGKGAFLNGSPIRVSTGVLLKNSLVGIDLGYSSQQGRIMLDITNKLWGHVHCLRILGSAALGLAYVACRRITIYLHRCIYPWDIASGLLLVREAGGEVIDWKGRPASFDGEQIIASNSKLHEDLVELLD